MKTPAKTALYKAMDNVDSLQAGRIYRAAADLKAKRTTVFTDDVTGHQFTLYRHQIDYALIRGLIKPYDATQSEAMHADIVGKLCQHTTTQYI